MEFRLATRSIRMILLLLAGFRQRRHCLLCVPGECQIESVISRARRWAETRGGSKAKEERILNLPVSSWLEDYGPGRLFPRRSSEMLLSANLRTRPVQTFAAQR